MMDLSYMAMIRALLALCFVLGLILGGVWLLRRFGSSLGTRSARRLGIVETLALDNRRRLLLIRRDDRLHLLLTGGAGGDLLIETLPATDQTAPPAAEERTTPL